MSTKKKLYMAIFSLCIMTIMALLTIASVFAAKNQSVSSQLDVSYHATNVAVTVRGDYLLKNDTSYTSMGANIEFSPAEAYSVKTMKVNGIAMTEVKNYTVFKYTFKNNSDDVGVNINLVSNVTNSSNITLTYYYATAEISNYNLISNNSFSQVTLNTSQTLYIYVKVKVVDLSTDASFSGSFNFNLSKTEV